MKQLTKLLTQCLFLTSFIVTNCYASSKINDDQVYQLMDKSGLVKSIDSLPMQMQGMGQQLALTAKNPEKHQKVMQAVTSSLDTQVILEKAAEHIKANVTTKELATMLAWLNSDLGSRIVSAELQASEPTFQQDFMRFMAELQTSPPSAERTKTIVGYVESSKIAEQTLNMIMAMMKNMFSAFKALQPANQDLAKRLDGQLDMMAKNMKPMFKQQTILSSYYIYRDISNDELSKYSQFYQSEAGKKYLSVILNGVGAGMNDWGNTLAQTIKDKVKQ